MPGWIRAVWSPRAPAAEPSPRRRLGYDVAWWALAMLFVLPAMGLPLRPVGVWQPLAAAIGFAVALRLRRTVPVAALLTVVTLGVWTAVESSGRQPQTWPQITLCFLFILSYLVGRLDDGRQPLLLQLTASVLLVVVLAPLMEIGLTDMVVLTVFMVFIVVFPWLLGRYRFQSAALTRSGWQRAEQLEREQRAVADQARLRERTRIAEDMHDSLGHELSLIALRAAALEVDRDLPRRHQEAAGELRRSAATATERLREIIGLLRDESEQASTTPADESIADLVERARDSGMDVTLHADAAAPRLPRMADRAMHRVVQEAVTNAAKHAPGSAVTVVVTSADEHNTVAVTNALPADSAGAGIGGGRGLVGLTERVRLAGGTLHSGCEGDVFRVTARLPHADAETVPDEPVIDTESVRQHVEGRTQARRRLLVAFALPAVMLALLGIASLSAYYVVNNNSTMSTKRFADVHEGQSREAANEILPRFQMFDPPDELGVTGLPSDARCEYYSSPDDTRGWSNVFEVCFADDVVIAKSVITSEERQQFYENRNGR